MTPIRIVISYRRQDTPGGAGRLRDGLAAHFGAENVFYDIDTIPPGVPWRKSIEKTISECDVLLPLIGLHWLTVSDELGRRRIDLPNDVLRFEIEMALKGNARIIPIQLHGAPMPDAGELPDEIAELTECQSLQIHDDDWPDDLKKLIRALETIRSEKAAASSSVEHPSVHTDTEERDLGVGARAAVADKMLKPSIAIAAGMSLLLVAAFLPLAYEAGPVRLINLGKDGGASLTWHSAAFVLPAVGVLLMVGRSHRRPTPTVFLSGALLGVTLMFLLLVLGYALFFRGDLRYGAYLALLGSGLALVGAIASTLRVERQEDRLPSEGRSIAFALLGAGFCLMPVFALQGARLCTTHTEPRSRRASPWRSGPLALHSQPSRQASSSPDDIRDRERPAERL